MKSQVLHTVWCHISCEAAGEFWHWSLSGVKGLTYTVMYLLSQLPLTILAFSQSTLTDVAVSSCSDRKAKLSKLCEFPLKPQMSTEPESDARTNLCELIHFTSVVPASVTAAALQFCTSGALDGSLNSHSDPVHFRPVSDEEATTIAPSVCVGVSISDLITPYTHQWYRCTNWVLMRVIGTPWRRQ